MSRQVTKSTLSKINEILGIEDSYQAPLKMMEILKHESKRNKAFSEFLREFEYDLSYDWFLKYFEDEHADRKNRKQDFTPISLSKLVSEMLESHDGVIYEPAAGTGGMIIQNWYKAARVFPPWEYSPLNSLYVCWEMSEKTLPFLLFNIMIRGINAVVIHGNTLTQEAKTAFHCLNEKNNPFGFSDICEVPIERIEKIFNIKFERTDNKDD